LYFHIVLTVVRKNSTIQKYIGLRVYLKIPKISISIPCMFWAHIRIGRACLKNLPVRRFSKEGWSWFRPRQYIYKIPRYTYVYQYNVTTRCNPMSCVVCIPWRVSEGNAAFRIILSDALWFPRNRRHQRRKRTRLSITGYLRLPIDFWRRVWYHRDNHSYMIYVHINHNIIQYGFVSATPSLTV